LPSEETHDDIRQLRVSRQPKNLLTLVLWQRASANFVVPCASLKIWPEYFKKNVITVQILTLKLKSLYQILILTLKLKSLHQILIQICISSK
jgi:hypothetical protein